jgi:hypothetical protein
MPVVEGAVVRAGGQRSTGGSPTVATAGWLHGPRCRATVSPPCSRRSGLSGAVEGDVGPLRSATVVQRRR